MDEDLEAQIQAATRKLTKAKVSMLLKDPFFATILLNLKWVANPNLPVGYATDGRNLYFRPSTVLEESAELCENSLRHEAMHITFFHPLRKGRRHHMKWNCAGDFVINWHIKQAGYNIGKNWLYDGKFANMSTEEVYSKLPEPKIIHTQIPNQSGKGNKNKDGKADSGQSQQYSSDYPVDGKKACGGLQDPKDKNGKPLSESQEKKLELDIKAMVIQAANVAKQAGKLPANIERLVNELREPQVPWNELFRQYMEKVSRNDYNWMRPNRRFIQQGLILPSLYNMELGEVVIIIDTSGSISQEELDAFASEANGVLQLAKPSKIYVLYVDAKLHAVDEYEAADLPLKLQMHGGGGTDFRPGFHWIEKNFIEPQIVIYMTDLHCTSYPDQWPNCPILWLYKQTQYGKGPKPPVGDFIKID